MFMRVRGSGLAVIFPPAQAGLEFLDLIIKSLYEKSTEYD